MASKSRSLRTASRFALVAIVAAVALSITVAGVGAQRTSFVNTLQQFFTDPGDLPGNINQSPRVKSDTVENTTCSANTAGGDGSDNAPSVSCPLTVLPNDNSTSVNARAPSTSYASSRVVYLIKASELAAVGYTSGQAVTTIGWNYQTGPGVAGSAPLKVYLQNTSDTTYLKGTSFATAISGMTTVSNATTSLPSASGPFDVTFSGGSPFTYTGGGLYIAYDWGPYTGTLGSVSFNVWCNSLGLTGGLAGNNTGSDTLSASSFRPETRLSSSGNQNDAAVTAIYSYGELPRGRVPAQAIKAVITNSGALTQTNLSVTLNVTGADTFTDTQVISSLAGCGATATVTFANFTPTNVGSDTITVSIPSDDFNANNSISQALSVTTRGYSYKIPGSTSSGGVGFTGGSGAFVSKFTTSAATTVTDVRLEFFAVSATTYRIAIYGDTGGLPSTTALYTDAADRTVTATGPVTITLPTPVAVGPGNFYVGIQQTNTTNANLSFDNENPIRAGAFYFATALPVATWFDESPGNSFKLNIGVNLKANARADFDGDGKTDLAVFRRSDGVWYQNRSTAGMFAVQWGNSTDTFLTGDYDGDGKADYGIFRVSDTPGVADFYILNSNGFTFSGYEWGSTGDRPTTGDYDGDGKIDIALFRPSNATWYIIKSQTGTVASFQFGANGDIPIGMDFNGDGKTDLVVFRPSNGIWYMADASGTPAQNFTGVQFGLSSDILAAADYDGDGKDDIAVWRPSDGTWYILRSSDGGVTYVQFGAAGDVPVPGDYDGDGKNDVAVYRNGTWFINRSTSGFLAQAFGAASDNPVPAAYHGQNGPPVGRPQP